MSTPIVTLTLPGRVGILKNSKRIFGKRGRGTRMKVLPSAKYVEWEARAAKAALYYVTGESWRGQLIDFPVELRARFYFANHSGEPDLSNCVQGPEDLLQKLGILKDDKLIYREITEKFFGHEPRVEIELYKYKQEEG